MRKHRESEISKHRIEKHKQNIIENKQQQNNIFSIYHLTGEVRGHIFGTSNYTKKSAQKHDTSEHIDNIYTPDVGAHRSQQTLYK